MFLRGRPVTGFAMHLRDRSTGANITSGTVTGHIVKDGESQTTTANAPAHKGNGVWAVNLTETEMDAKCIFVEFTHADGEVGQLIVTTRLDPDDDQRAGLGALPVGVPDEPGGMFVIGGATRVSGGASADEIWGAPVTAMIGPGSIGDKLRQWVPGIAQTGDVFALLGTPPGGTVAQALADVLAGVGTIDANVANVQARLPASLANGRIRADVEAIAGNEASAANLRESTSCLAVGTVGTGSTTGVIQAQSVDPSITVTNQFKNRLLIFSRDTPTTPLRGVVVEITAVSVAGAFTVAPVLPVAPQDGDKFVIT